MSSVLSESARRHPLRAAVKVGDEALTYAELEGRSDRMAGALVDRAVSPGDRVAVMLPNTPQFLIAYYGALKAGAVVVPLNPLLRAREVTLYLRDSGAKVLVAWHASLQESRAGAAAAGVEAVIGAGRPEAQPPGVEALEEVLDRASPAGGTVQRDPGAAASLVYTSGTTGGPKGAVLTHSSLLWNAHLTALALGYTDEDVLLGTLPFFHVAGGSCVMNAAISVGARLVLMPRFDPVLALDLAEGEEVSVLPGVPTMWSALLATGSGRQRNLSRLRLCATGAAPIAQETREAVERRFGLPLLQVYGLSECSGAVSVTRPDSTSTPGSVGTPLWGVEMKIVDGDGREVPPGEVGEISVRGHCLMTGYHDRPEATAAAIDAEGWFRTGDVGRKHGCGSFTIVDRKKDVIIRGGYNVFPREVEEVIYEHPAVLEAAVFGLPHEGLGEEVAAAVVARPGSDLDPEDLKSFVKERVAPYKYPRTVELVETLPKGPSGKILKRELREAFQADGVGLIRQAQRGENR